MTMTEEKPWYLSKGVLGPLVAVVALIAGAFGVKVDAATQALVVDQVIGAVSAGVALLGAIVGIWGRITATKVIQ
jgi:hypothetical protein